MDVGNGTSQTTSAHAPGFHEAFRNGTSSDEHDNGKRVPQSYAEWREKVLRLVKFIQKLANMKGRLEQKLPMHGLLNTILIWHWIGVEPTN